MIIDTSVLLEIYFKDSHAKWAKDQLKRSITPLKMSMVNLAETLIRLRDRQPNLFDQLQKSVLDLPIEFVPVSLNQTLITAEARLKYKGLNFGDCFAYALAKTETLPLIAIDSDFKKTDVEVIRPD